jgi:hypothetical protein
MNEEAERLFTPKGREMIDAFYSDDPEHEYRIEAHPRGEIDPHSSDRP